MIAFQTKIMTCEWFHTQSHRAN